MLLFSKLWAAVIIQILSFIIGFFLYSSKIIGPGSYSFVCLAKIIPYLFFGALDSGKFVRKNIIYYISKDSLPSFWIRKKDEIKVGIIVAVVTIPLTIIITKLLK